MAVPLLYSILQQEPVNHTPFLSVISTYMASMYLSVCAIYVLMTLRNSVWFTDSCCKGSEICCIGVTDMEMTLAYMYCEIEV